MAASASASASRAGISIRSGCRDRDRADGVGGALEQVKYMAHYMGRRV